MRLISSLAGQIRASVDIDTTTQGTTFRIELAVPDEVPLLETSSPEEISG